jgi:DNA-binding winged helix-turn-helix (wHTH) protein
MREFHPFRLDLLNQCLWRRRDGEEDQRILLTPKGFAMLHYLVERAGRLVTQDELLEALWPETYVQPEVLKSHIRDIRSALGDDPKVPRFIETMPRRGYLFIAPIKESVGNDVPEVESAASNLVGRKAELDRLEGYFQRALQGERGIVFVTGEAGIGKTTLVDAFQLQAGANISALRVARGQCVEGYGGQEPYYPMLEALGQLCQGGRQDSVVQVLASQAPMWLVQFPALMKRGQQEKLQREILGAGRERMLREIADALETITAESPMLLIFEDLHWADNSTIDLMSVLARRRRAAKLLLVATYRPVDVVLAEHPLKALKQDLLVHHLCHEIALEPLSEAEIGEYLAAESKVASLPEGLASLLFRHSEGNPLFMVAALEHLKARKLIAEENGNWKMNRATEEIDVQAPDNLRQVIEGQIDQLNTEEQQSLEAASVMGTIFSSAVAARAANLNTEAFENTCERLSRRHQIVRSLHPQQLAEGGLSETYGFVHALYREVLYQSLSPGRKAKLHLQIGEGLEVLQASRLSEAAAELAHHFEHGGDWLRAIRYLKLAADTAGRRFEPRQAGLILEHALELVSKLPEAARMTPELEILEKLGAIYVVCFDTRAIQIYEALADRASQAGLVDVEVRALLAMTLPLAWVNGPKYLETLDRALQRSTSQDPVAQERTRITCLLSHLGAEWNSRDAEECRKAYAAIRERDDRVALRSLVEWSYFHFNSSQYREAHRCATEGLAMLIEESAESPYLSATHSMYQHNITRIHLFLGEWGNALKEADAQSATATKNGNPDLAHVLGVSRAYIHLHGTDFDGAWRICESVLRVPTWEGMRRFCRIVAGCADAGRNSPESALEHLWAVRNDMERQPLMEDWQLRMPLQWGFTDACLAKGDLTQARMEAEQFLRVTLSSEEHTWRSLAFEANARVAIAERDLQRAEDCILKAVQEMEGFEVPLAAWRVHATASELYARMGDRDLAERQRELSHATIIQLANSMSNEEPLRKTFLSASAIRNVLGRQEAIANTI